MRLFLFETRSLFAKCSFFSRLKHFYTVFPRYKELSLLNETLAKSPRKFSKFGKTLKTKPTKAVTIARFLYTVGEGYNTESRTQN